MKKQMFVGLLMVLLLSVAVRARAEEAFELDTTAVVTGMSVSWQQGYTPSIEGNTMTLYLPIRSEQSRGYITGVLLHDGLSVTPFSARQSKANAQKQNGVYPLKLALSLLSERRNGDYPIIIRVTGQDADGQALLTDIPLTISIRNALPPQQAHRPSISVVSADFTAGEECLLTLSLSNPATCITMENLLLTVSEARGDILPSGSNRLSLPRLLSGESQVIEIPLTVLPTAAIGLHTLTLELSYTALDEPMIWSECFTLPVTQPMRLSYGDLGLSSQLLQGELATMTLPIMNLGRAELVNVFVFLTLPGIVQRQAVLLGAIAPGETKQARLTFTPGKDILGDLSGTVTISAEDAWGNTTSLSFPVTTTIEAPPVAVNTATAYAEEASQKSIFWLPWALGGLCLLLLLAMMIQGARWRRKICLLEEEKL